MLNAARFLGALAGLAAVHCGCYAADRLLPTADEIRHEATLPTLNPLGHPLPLLASWSTGQYRGGFDPLRQLSLIEEGHYLLPWFYLPPPTERFNLLYYKQAIDRAAELRLPISFLSTQWESLLTIEPKFFGLPADRNPNLVTTRGVVLKEVSPFGPVGYWKDAGREWTQGSLVKRLQNRYPDPPLVLFISNNEHPKLSWPDTETSKRFVERYGAAASDDTKRRAVGDGWIERYRALQQGMREGLTAEKWKSNVRFIGYDAFGPAAMGRWDGWPASSLHVAGRFSPMPLAWDGASPSYYLNAWEPTTDFTVWSPEIQAMNWVFMQAEATRLNPDFWFELSVWDGHQADPAIDKREFFRKMGESYTAERYAGFVKFGMWLLRPRVIREFRYLDDFRDFEPYVMGLAHAVDDIHNNPILRRFWRTGQLVANSAHRHPYQASIPKEYANVPRWFLLDTNRDAPRPWDLGTNIPVLSLALELGVAPEREWLVYAFSPRDDMLPVVVELPNYGKVEVQARRSGTYVVISESRRSISVL